MRWLFFPPVLSFPLLLLSAIFHDRTSAAHIPETIWGMTVAAYVCLCALSLFHIMKGDDRYDAGISSLTQGLLLSVMSLQFGVTFMAWIGLVLFLIGLAMTFFYATRRSAEVVPDFKAAPQDDGGASARIDSLIEKLGLPICYTDSKGVIAGATAFFCEALGKEPDSVIGSMVSDILPIDSEEVVLETGKWWLRQEKDGARYYFSLRPTQDYKPEQATVVSAPPDARSIYEQTTGLYTDDYRKIRGPEEVSRAQRYKRPLSGLLLSLSFEPSNDVKLTGDQVAMLDNAFKTRVQAALRTTDCGFLMADGRVQVLLPETPQAGAKTLLGRITTMPQDIFDEEIRTAVNPRVRGGMFFYNGASRMEYGIFSAALEEAFLKGREGVDHTASQAA